MAQPLLMHGFLRAQFTYLIRTFPLRRSLRHKLWILAEVGQLLVRYGWLLISLRFGGRSGTFGDKTCAVVLLSHNRPQNLTILARGALSNEFVTKVVISNSNRDVRIAEWVDVQDPRLVLINETKPTQPGHRLILSRDTGSRYLLAVDDDIFLTPCQWSRLFQTLVSDENRPHGLTGNQYHPGTKSSNGSPFHHITGVEAEVDVLIGAYAFTSEHLNRVFELATVAGIHDISQVRNYDDILLSFGGTRPPRIHAITPALLCASASLPGIALWKSREEFWEERVRVFESLREARITLQSPWPTNAERECRFRTA
ncbi:MAG: hypothetical protein ACR2MF_00315 [Chthoniobacterales bacterium]